MNKHWFEKKKLFTKKIIWITKIINKRDSDYYAKTFFFYVIFISSIILKNKINKNIYTTNKYN